MGVLPKDYSISVRGQIQRPEEVKNANDSVISNIQRDYLRYCASLTNKGDAMPFKTFYKIKLDQLKEEYDEYEIDKMREELGLEDDASMGGR